MNAKEMFSKCGYKQIIYKNDKDDIYLIEYVKKKSRNVYSYYEFWIVKREVRIGCYDDYFNLHHDYTFYPKSIPLNQLEAIIQQCKESGFYG